MHNINQFFDDLKSNGVVKELNQTKDIISRTQRVQKYYLSSNATGYYIKNSSNVHGITAVASSRLYQAAGLNTPPVFILKNKFNDITSTVQQDICSLKDLILTLASNDFKYKKIKNIGFGHDKFQLLYDENLQSYFLRFMTPNCLNDLINVYLVDELRTDPDKHLSNYFFFRSEGSEKYEGIISIDLEYMKIYRYNPIKKDDFLNFLYYPYQSATPQQNCDELCYQRRIDNLRGLIQEGNLNDNNIKTLKNTLRYDFPQEIKLALKERRLHGKEKKQILVPVQRLWDYNQNTLGKDLGL